MKLIALHLGGVNEIQVCKQKSWLSLQLELLHEKIPLELENEISLLSFHKDVDSIVGAAHCICCSKTV